MNHAHVFVHGMSAEDVIHEVESVFQFADQSTLSLSQGVDAQKGIDLLLRPILDSFSRVDCPMNFSTPQAWPEANRTLFRVCLYAVLGKLTMGRTVFSEGDLQAHAECRFVIDPQTGMLVNGDAAQEVLGNGQSISTKNTIMSALVVILVISMGLMLYLKGI